MNVMLNIGLQFTSYNFSCYPEFKKASLESSVISYQLSVVRFAHGSWIVALDYYVLCATCCKAAIAACFSAVFLRLPLPTPYIFPCTDT